MWQVHMDNNQEKILLTPEGLEELKKEYRELVEVKRPAEVERLAGARQAGDLSENSEYTHAKEELSFIDGRISELEDVINRALLINGNHHGCKEVNLGCKVTVKTDGNKQLVFHLVGEWEADPTVKKISHSSPLGKSLLGKKVGDNVEVTAPVGKIIYTIVNIN